MTHCTILIPAYNTRPWIQNAVFSALAQDWPDFDVFVVDDGSTDGTGTMVEHLLRGRQVSLWKMPHRGLPAVLADGIKMASGPVITFVASDDYMEPTALSAVVPHFDDPKVGFVWSAWRFMGKEESGWSRSLPQGRTLWQSLVLDGWWKAGCHQFFSKEWYLRSRGLDIKIPYAVDYQLAILLAETGCKTVHVSTPTYRYRYPRPGSISHSNGRRQRECCARLRREARNRAGGRTS